jgi:hypothetical protein
MKVPIGVLALKARMLDLTRCFAATFPLVISASTMDISTDNSSSAQGGGTALEAAGFTAARSKDPIVLFIRLVCSFLFLANIIRAWSLLAVGVVGAAAGSLGKEKNVRE